MTTSREPGPPDVERRLSLLVPSDLGSVALVAAMARGLCEAYLGGSGSLVDVALAEACANVVRHAHPDAPERVFRVDVRVDAHRVEFVITDEGAPYDFAGREMPAVETAAPESLPEAGFGIPLIKSIMDAAEYHREGARNVLRLVKHRAGHRPAPPAGG